MDDTPVPQEENKAEKKIAKRSKTPRSEFPSLEHLFGSKIRARLLSLFVHHPDRKYFIRELTREIGAQIHSVRRELENLEKLKILISEETVESDESGLRVKRKYYWTSPDSLLFPELYALMMKAELFVEKNLGEHVKKLGDFVYVALTGRFVGDLSMPVDLVFVGTPNEIELKKFLEVLKNEVGYDVNYTVFSREEYRYRKEVMDKFLYRILEGRKTVLMDRFMEEIEKKV